MDIERIINNIKIIYKTKILDKKLNNDFIKGYRYACIDIIELLSKEKED